MQVGGNGCGTELNGYWGIDEVGQFKQDQKMRIVAFILSRSDVIKENKVIIINRISNNKDFGEQHVLRGA